MSNMGYCRFTNTLADMEDCLENIDDNDLSPEEKNARDAFILICTEVHNGYGEDDN